MDNELKLCPFCDGEAEENYAAFDYNFFGVQCTVCGAYVYDTDSAAGARKKWNNRVNTKEC